jgi:methylmalonyl-CoA mutase C-terminal domain/subunit
MPIRVLMSKPGIDGHWRGISVVSRGLRDAGFEVIFGGFQTVEEIVETAIQEDVDVIGLSIHSGAHFKYSERVLELMDKKGIKDNVLVLAGGPIPRVDIPKLKEMGVGEVFIPGSMISDMVDFIKSNVKRKSI